MRVLGGGGQPPDFEESIPESLERDWIAHRGCMAPTCRRQATGVLVGNAGGWSFDLYVCHEHRVAAWEFSNGLAERLGDR